MVFDRSTHDAGDVTSSFVIYKPDGSQATVISRMMTGNAAAAKALGMDKTDIGVETFTPPLGADYLALAARAKRGDAAAKQQLMAKCPDMKE